MKRLLLFLMFIQSACIFGAVDIQLVPIEHNYHVPISGRNTVTMDVMAKTRESQQHFITVFQGAIQFKNILVPDLDFDKKYFPEADYHSMIRFDEELSRLYFCFTLVTSAKKTINSNWQNILRISLSYRNSNLIPENSWSVEEPEFLVADDKFQDITGQYMLFDEFMSPRQMLYQFPAPGWYLLSIPGSAEDMSVSTLFPLAENQKAFRYDEFEQSYVTVDTVQSGTGYWISVPQSFDRSISFLPRYQLDHQIIVPGWHLIGSILETQFVESIQIDGPDSSLVQILSYSPFTLSHSPAKAIEPGKAYWLQAAHPCKIKIGNTQFSTSRRHRMTQSLAKNNQPPPPPPDELIDKTNQSGAVKRFTVFQNYPNPFNPVTHIRFQVPTASICVLEIFNMAGQRVRQLTNRHYQAGEHQLDWNGLDDKGEQVSSGTYIYRFSAANVIQERKLVLLK